MLQISPSLNRNRPADAVVTAAVITPDSDSETTTADAEQRLGAAATHSTTTTTAVTPCFTCMPRVVCIGFTIQKSTFEFIPPTLQVAKLWRVLDLCVVPAEQRRRCVSSSGCDGNDFIPTAALKSIHVMFSRWPRANTPTLGPLSTNYPALTRSLQVLKIAWTNYDESAALSAFAALATNLQELSFWECGLTSVKGLEGRCEYLRKLDLYNCSYVSSLEGIGHHWYLEEVHASNASLTSIEDLRTCPALRKVNLSDCELLASLEGLEGHQRLREVDVSCTAITSIEPLQTCPALIRVILCDCRRLLVIPSAVDFSAPDVCVVRSEHGLF